MILCFYLQVHYGLVVQSRGTCAILDLHERNSLCLLFCRDERHSSAVLYVCVVGNISDPKDS